MALMWYFAVKFFSHKKNQTSDPAIQISNLFQKGESLEDFPRAPSPVYNNQSRLPNHITLEQTAEEDALILPSPDSSIKATILQLEVTTGGVHVRHPISYVYPAGLIPTRDVGVASVSTYSNRSGRTHQGLKEKLGNNDDISHNDVLSNALVGTNIGRAKNEPKSSKISND